MARIVDQRNHARNDIRSDAEFRAVNVLGKGLGSRLDLASLAVLVNKLPRKLLGRLWRLSEQERHDERNLLDHVHFIRANDGRRDRSPVDQAAQLQRKLAELGLDDAVEDARVLCVPAVRVQALRHEAILLDEVVHHVPLAAVRNKIPEQPLHDAAVEVVLGRLDNLLEEPVGLFELVPVEEVGLGQLKRRQVVTLHEGHAEDVCRGKEPATPTRPLVGDGIAFKRNLDVEDVLVCNLYRWRNQSLPRIRRAQGGVRQSGEVALSSESIMSPLKEAVDSPIFRILHHRVYPELERRDGQALRLPLNMLMMFLRLLSIAAGLDFEIVSIFHLEAAEALQYKLLALRRSDRLRRLTTHDNDS